MARPANGLTTDFNLPKRKVPVPNQLAKKKSACPELCHEQNAEKKSACPEQNFPVPEKTPEKTGWNGDVPVLNYWDGDVPVLN